ncbi:DMT family transporter [Motiliproteus sp. MSK22-1]|uniref:DMT family transporter n=1 Tax=Motiliproteus sp. MSK22-1 TaxID=1897630 RepID=UPI001E6160D8|nr:DMT family transporter [Motiliproteus sp. MSK22-1]
MSTSTALTIDHSKGIKLAAAGVLVLSFDALLIRLAGVDPWDVTFWRGALMALSMLAIMMAGGKHNYLGQLRPYWKGMLLIAFIYGINGTLFVLSISHTSTANTVVILSSSSFFAAFFSWLFLRERVDTRTWAAIGVSVAGVVTVFSGSFGLENWVGDLLALLLALSMGLVLTLMRRYPEVPRTPMVAISGLVMMVIAIPFSAPFELAQSNYFWLAVMGLVQIPLASVLIMSATRYLSSPEVSLFLLIETVFGPIWVWLVLSEQVPPMTLVGGTAILGAIVVHSWLSLRNAKERSR